MIGTKKLVHYNRVFTTTLFTINGIDCIFLSLYNFALKLNVMFPDIITQSIHYYLELNLLKEAVCHNIKNRQI
jgi:hypothetical protein